MPIQDSITRSLAIVDQTLREVFPEDFDHRCMYAAFGLRLLLKKVGFNPQIVGGDFLCFVLSTDSRKATLQGFGSHTSPEPSHYWVEADSCLIDLGPGYLPRGSSFPAAPIPVIRWSLAAPLPRFLRYRERIRYASEVTLQSDAEIMTRMDDFLIRCRERSQNQSNLVTMDSWQLKDPTSLRAAALKGNPWARGAITFAQRMSQDQLPF